MKKFKTKIVNDVTQLPEGARQLSDLVPRDDPRRKTKLKWLSDAHIEGRLQAHKLVRTMHEMRTGPVYLDHVESQEYLRQTEIRLSSPPAAATDSPPPGLVSIDEKLDCILRWVEAIDEKLR